MILVTHCYSAKNRGDGLLVELSAELLSEALPGEPLEFVALDPTSFLPRLNPHTAPFARVDYSKKSIASVMRFVKTSSSARRNLKGLLRDARMVVAVGGGYLRAGTWVESLKTILAHGTQLKLSVSSGKALIYLPQSVGPLRIAIFSNMLRKWLRQVNVLYLRDDRSMQELSSCAGKVRVPDLAILKLGAIWQEIEKQNTFSRVYLIARSLSRNANSEHYEQAVSRLRELIPNVEIVLQSEGGGNDDMSFYRSKLGVCSPVRSLREAVSESGPGVVISVRLHGSLEALHLGCPTIHLSYERKGFGAADDLGIQEYTHVAFKFDAQHVADQAARLMINAEPYWKSIEHQMPEIRESRDLIIRELRRVYDGR